MPRLTSKAQLHLTGRVKVPLLYEKCNQKCNQETHPANMVQLATSSRRNKKNQLENNALRSSLTV